MRGTVLILSVAIAGCSIDSEGTGPGLAVDASVATDTNVEGDALFPIDDTAIDDTNAAPETAVDTAVEPTDTATPEDTCPACPPLATCVASACECPKNSAICGGRCVDVQADPGRCGTCDAALPCDSGSMCAKGVCACQPKLTLCDGTCVDTKGHASYCGGCADTDKCAPNQRCKDGVCVNEASTMCPSTRPDECPGDEGRKSCFDLKRDPMHCGGCSVDKRCTADQFCVEGVCQKYVVGVGCSTCPCPSCETLSAGSKCCNAPPGWTAGRVVCVNATACPAYLP